ncbi:hypothetical protein LB467_09870 [Salegentibacter sp. JZCK2]|uniref:hypothetical protein n=1 Tax=Salegentibacter tibetensis TaxID=2873600 RepID=UPI001CCD8A4B|nr:hypothetical protein [Salegentibacter tibetensis]MBZ9729992.1 hypothetical protein [Salegentibacter tibetensis]
MNLAELIKKSYGSADLIFVSHQLEIDYARKSLEAAENENVGYEEFLEKHKEFLRSQNCSDEHIERQILKVQDLSNYFSND